MGTEYLDEFLEALAGYIYDDDKLVTYKWLSKELEVHVNVAKQILWEFGERHKHEGNLERTFLLIGTLCDGGVRVEIVKESDIVTARKKFTTILSEHIYSLQKSLRDIELLAISDKGDVRHSAITCKESIERNSNEMQALRWGMCETNHLKQQGHEEAKSLVDNVNKQAKILHAHSNIEKKTTEKKESTAQKTGLYNLFGKSLNKQKCEISGSTNMGKTDSLNKEGISELQKEKERKKNHDHFENEKNTDKDISIHPKKKETINHIADQVDQNTKNRKQNNVRGKKRNRSKDVDASKKRKRIMVQSESESSHEEEDEEPQTMELSPPHQDISHIKENTPSPPQVKHENGNRKVLKVVDKTYKEGNYLVTKKVHVYESCPEEDEKPTETYKSITPKPHPETKTKKNTKQIKLTNFFKKS